LEQAVKAITQHRIIFISRFCHIYQGSWVFISLRALVFSILSKGATDKGGVSAIVSPSWEVNEEND